MSSLSISDGALSAAKMALDGLSMRQQVISRNIANVDTPGYQAQSLSFESAIQNALKQNQPKMAVTNAAHLAAPVPSMTQPMVAARSGGSMRADGNNVDIDTELIEMSETGIKYDALTQVVSKKLQLLKSIATSR